MSDLSCRYANLFRNDYDHAWGSGLGASPAVVDGRVYFSELEGKIYCVDATTLQQVWVTDLRSHDLAQNQPLDNVDPPVACWTSPLVIQTPGAPLKNVYVGVGLGEEAGARFTTSAAHGFVYCLDATDGRVKWLFCTNKFPDVTDNSPNHVPPSRVAYLGGQRPPAPFVRTQLDPSSLGASVWSSCAYDAQLNRIYVGTGNSQPDEPLPDPLADGSAPPPVWPYSSGVLALDADSGEFRGFFQPVITDSYRPDDTDIDVPSSPTLFTREDGTRVVAIGSKSGAYFLLQPLPQPVAGQWFRVLARRQLLPYTLGPDTNGRRPVPIPAIDPHTGPAENEFGVYGTTAVHSGLRRLFVGLGKEIDTATTPFMRVLDWHTLTDSWPLSGPSEGGVARYANASPPMYTTQHEAGLSSPAVVNDLVFVSTNKPTPDGPVLGALYAFDALSGLCRWSDQFGAASIGPAISGDYVVIGTQAGELRIYRLPLGQLQVGIEPYPVRLGAPVQYIVSARDSRNLAPVTAMVSIENADGIHVQVPANTPFAFTFRERTIHHAPPPRGPGDEVIEPIATVRANGYADAAVDLGLVR